MSKPRVLVAGLGDTGLLTAIHLSSHVDVVGVSTKPGLVSGQELGMVTQFRCLIWEVTGSMVAPHP